MASGYKSGYKSGNMNHGPEKLIDSQIAQNTRGTHNTNMMLFGPTGDNLDLDLHSEQGLIF